MHKKEWFSEKNYIKRRKKQMERFSIQVISVVIAFAIWDLIKFGIKKIIRAVKDSKNES